MTQPIHPMLERVARAMWERTARDFPDNGAWEVQDGYLRDLWLEKARVAIQALIEPDEGMVEAAAEAWPEGSNGLVVLGDLIRDMHKAMLIPLIGEGE